MIKSDDPGTTLKGEQAQNVIVNKAVPKGAIKENDFVFKRSSLLFQLLLVIDVDIEPRAQSYKTFRRLFRRLALQVNGV